MKQKGLFSSLCLYTVGSLALATGSVLVLGPEDKISIARGMFILVLGFVFFLSLFDFLNHVALKTNSGLKIRKKYQLTMSDVLDISNKVVSAVQAALSCAAGTIVCMWSCTRSFLHSNHFMSEAYAWFGAAYFFYDIWSMYKVHISIGIPTVHSSEKTLKKISANRKNNQVNDCATVHPTGDGNNCVFVNENGSQELKQKDDFKVVQSFFSYCKDQPIIIMHHLFIGGFGFLVIVYLRGGLGDCVFGAVYLMELSTPFVSLRSILSRMKLKASQLYVVNGIAMLVSFFICRIMLIPYLCHMYSQTIGLPYWEAVRGLPTGCKISISILLFPQLYWFYLMMRGATKVFFTSAPKAPAEVSDQISTDGTTSSTKNRVSTNGSSSTS